MNWGPDKPDTLDIAAGTKHNYSTPRLMWADGSWSKNGRWLFPLPLYAVVKDRPILELEWFDFSRGEWSGVLTQHTVTSSETFAKLVAEKYKADVKTYSLIQLPKDEGDEEEEE